MQIWAEFDLFSEKMRKKEFRCPELKATASEKTQFLSREMSLFEVDNDVALQMFHQLSSSFIKPRTVMEFLI